MSAVWGGRSEERSFFLKVVVREKGGGAVFKP